MAAPDYEAVTRKQLAMNEQAWKLLRDRGLTDQTKIKLDFFYDAPNKSAADSLIAVMRGETDYELLPPRSAGPLWQKKWSVSGSTQPTSLSLDILNQWVIWMVDAGMRGGGCVFDGWGAEVPKA